MSHAETIHRLNAAMNTPDTWARRWQVEREQNERLHAEAQQIRTGIHGLRQRANERFTHNQQYATEARNADDPRRAEIYERICITDHARVRALDDVLELMDAISRQS